MSLVVSLDIDRPNLTRVCSNRVGPSHPSSLPIQIAGATRGYPIGTRPFRAQDCNDDINRDNVLIYLPPRHLLVIRCGFDRIKSPPNILAHPSMPDSTRTLPKTHLF
ncbi:uncharacterized protein FPRO_12037 [Fusarium proliferatum ET1]|uniref:Uncharacterized protein n=1 Tax=Fusarium proliferatum (strain ET1) TaxID=1227346 RepID=A0A1L7W1Q9_FUSPR|nr:uncharacterized protein FPRO_12037 [Fusarium proliferatum ET1]CZR46587.1 uncharacterized protein FPRO_12037 [Fusarium proliferatum ET1]